MNSAYLEILKLVLPDTIALVKRLMEQRHTTEFPTVDELRAELDRNADAVLAEGDAWRASRRPTEPPA